MLHGKENANIDEHFFTTDFIQFIYWQSLQTLLKRTYSPFRNLLTDRIIDDYNFILTRNAISSFSSFFVIVGPMKATMIEFSIWLHVALENNILKMLDQNYQVYSAQTSYKLNHIIREKDIQQMNQSLVVHDTPYILSMDYIQIVVN